MKRKPTSEELNQEIERLHKLGREHYDTPGSIRYCSCKSCNTARKIHGKPLNLHRVRTEITYQPINNGVAGTYCNTYDEAKNMCYEADSYVSESKETR